MHLKTSSAKSRQFCSGGRWVDGKAAFVKCDSLLAKQYLLQTMTSVHKSVHWYVFVSLMLHHEKVNDDFIENVWNYTADIRA